MESLDHAIKAVAITALWAHRCAITAVVTTMLALLEVYVSTLFIVPFSVAIVVFCYCMMKWFRSTKASNAALKSADADIESAEAIAEKLLEGLEDGE